MREEAIHAMEVIHAISHIKIVKKQCEEVTPIVLSTNDNA